MDKRHNPVVRTLPIGQSERTSTAMPTLQIISPQAPTGSTPVIISGGGIHVGHILPQGETTANVLSSGPTTLMVTEDIHQQNQTAQLFFERLLQNSCSQIQAESSVLTADQHWSSVPIGVVADSHMTENIVKMSTSPTIQGTDSMMLQSISPQSNVSSVTMVTVKQSVSPNMMSASPNKRSRKQCSESRETSGHKSRCLDRLDSGNSAGVVVIGDVGRRERSISEGSSDSVGTGRPRGAHVSDGGRTSRERSESESDMSDTMVMLGSVTPDDTRRQMAGSVTPETSDLGFQPSMLEAVLTEKKMALLRSPEIRKFLQQQQAERAQEQKVAHSTQTAMSKGVNS